MALSSWFPTCGSQTEQTIIFLRLCASARKKIRRGGPAILRGRLQSREGAKNWELFLCGSAALHEKKIARKVAKPPRPPEAKPSGPQLPAQKKDIAPLEQ